MYIKKEKQFSAKTTGVKQLYLHAFKRSQVSWLDLFLFLFWVNKKYNNNKESVSKALKQYLYYFFTQFFISYRQISCGSAGRTITVPLPEVWKGKWVYIPPLPSVLKTQCLCWYLGFWDGFWKRRKTLQINIMKFFNCYKHNDFASYHKISSLHIHE